MCQKTSFAKQIVWAMAFFVISPFAVIALIGKKIFNSDGFFNAFSQFLIFYHESAYS